MLTLELIHNLIIYYHNLLKLNYIIKNLMSAPCTIIFLYIVSDKQNMNF